MKFKIGDLVAIKNIFYSIKDNSPMVYYGKVLECINNFNGVKFYIIELPGFSTNNDTCNIHEKNLRKTSKQKYEKFQQEMKTKQVLES
jgi:hypothetical protein